MDYSRYSLITPLDQLAPFAPEQKPFPQWPLSHFSDLLLENHKPVLGRYYLYFPSRISSSIHLAIWAADKT